MELLPDLIPTVWPALVPVLEHTPFLPLGETKFDSNSLSVPLECPEQYHVLSIPDVKPTSVVKPTPSPAKVTVLEPHPALIPVPGPTLVTVAEKHVDLPSGDTSPAPVSSPGLALLPLPEREPA
ncbi:uncharacterized protein [Macrobrachium rosenbergii]|uniref:uncharacterized protein n=1 Tax=Macrobrachium rosenbergii TaxID=79674 RepID=UPI0034D690FF